MKIWDRTFKFMSASTTYVKTKLGDLHMMPKGDLHLVPEGGDIVVTGAVAVTGNVAIVGNLYGGKRPIALKTDNYTVLATESGTVFKIATDAKVFTLPATAEGLWYTFVNSGADGNNILTISPQAADSIIGGGLTSVDDKDLINTKATAKEGDTVTLVADGVDGWFITDLVGTWAKET